MRKLLIALSTVMMALSAVAQETDRMAVEDLIISPGQEVEVGISLINQAEIYEALQCNIALPEGLEFVQAYGTARRPSYIELTDRCEDMDITSCNIASFGELAGSLAVVLTTDPGLSIYENDGAIFHITVKATDGLHASSEIVVKNVVLTETGYISHYLDNATSTVTKPSTLADYIDSGVIDKPCIINEALTCAYISSDGQTMWLKDDNGFAQKDVPPYAPTDEQTAAGKALDNAADFDQSNWVAVTLPQALSAEQVAQYLGHTVTGITGVLNDKLNPAITIDELPTIGDANEFTANVYRIANFDEQAEYWLVPPKAQEYAQVTSAVYNDGAFYMPAASTKYNVENLIGVVSANLDNYEGETLVNGTRYEITGIIKALQQRASSAPAAQHIAIVDGEPTAYYSIDLLTAVAQPELGYYLIGDFNEWTADDAYAFVEESDGTWTITRSVNAGDEFAVLGADNVRLGAAAGGDAQAVVLTPVNASVALASGEDIVNFKINIAGEYTFTISDNTLTITGWPTGISLDDALDGANGWIADDLVVAYVANSTLYTTNGSKWLTINGIDNQNVAAGYVIPGYQIEASAIVNPKTAPAIDVSSLRIEEGNNVPPIIEHDLANHLDPMPIAGEVIKITGYYNVVDDVPSLCGFSGLNGKVGQFVDITNPNQLQEREQYTAHAVVSLKEAWDEDNNNAPRRAKKDEVGAFTNLTLTLIDMPIATAIESLDSDNDVLNVRYINAAGMVSDKAFEGVNIVVTTYQDGTQQVTKVMR